ADGDAPSKLWPVSDRASEPAVVQLSLFGGPHPVADALKKLDINALSPLEALNKLYELQKIAQK
ncbi:MAG TPA: hypothetical protein VL334_00445, partial [Anaerolineae bacterium]|nr:hypothetical protein [Anaerolineae bacterium]